MFKFLRRSPKASVSVLTAQPPRIEADGWDGLRPPPMFCDQCGRETSWLSNEFALVRGHMCCSTCNRVNSETAAFAPEAVWD